ncbi:MAG: hypothetical protein ACI8SK_001656 [Shewanella sp.]|jgi:hypothetical protein
MAVLNMVRSIENISYRLILLAVVLLTACSGGDEVATATPEPVIKPVVENITPPMPGSYLSRDSEAKAIVFKPIDTSSGLVFIVYIGDKMLSDLSFNADSPLFELTLTDSSQSSNPSAGKATVAHSDGSRLFTFTFEGTEIEFELNTQPNSLESLSSINSFVSSDGNQSLTIDIQGNLSGTGPEKCNYNAMITERKVADNNTFVSQTVDESSQTFSISNCPAEHKVLEGMYFLSAFLDSSNNLHMLLNKGQGVLSRVLKAQ